MKKSVQFFFLLLTAFLTTGLSAIAQPAAKNVWEEQEPYVQGFARVMQAGHFSFINKTGTLIHTVEFDGARNFSNHLAAVRKDDKWGFINESGKLVIPFRYSIAYDFTETVTAVYSNKKWELINTMGAVVSQPAVDAVYGFANGRAKIAKNGKWGSMNTKGEIVMNASVAAGAPVLNTPAAKTVNNANSFATSVSVCPDNIDFEYGSFFNWQCYVGHVDSIGTTNVITVNPSPPTPNRHTLFTRSIPSLLDPFGLFPINPPDGSNFALKLGNTQIGAEAEKVRYSIHVPVNDSNFSIRYDYAVVFEDPGHTLWSQPRFQVTVIDSATNTAIQCATFEYVSTSGLPGFTRSTVDTGVIFKPWSSVFLSLRGYAGKTMYLDFTNADCVRRGHWGYSYIDVEKPCGQAAEINYDCDSPHVTTLTGPPGFQTYNWWDSAFTTLLGSGQTLTLNPGPSINTTIWLEMIPFNNFGCLDTLPVKITGVFTADFNISDTNAVCAPHSFTFFNPYLPSTSTSWDFGDGTTGTGDTVTHIYTTAGTYLVQFDVTLPNGCIGSGYKLVTITQPVGSFSFDGTLLCDSRQVRFDAVTNAADTLFWNFGDGTTLQTTAKTVYHTYTASGVYIPSLMLKNVGGCVSMVPATDTIKVELLDAGFTSSVVKTCGSTTITLTDTSHAYFGIATRKWDFGDGTIVNGGTSVSHTYTTPGNYNVSLFITGTIGCADTASIPVNITVNAIPSVVVNGPDTVCQNVPLTLTSAVTSADPINYYHWTVSNGQSGGSANMTTFFTVAGTYTFQLVVGTVNGCFDTTTHVVVVNPTPDVVAPPDQVLCSGAAAAAVNFSGSVSGTTYNWTNTAPAIGLAATGTGNIPSFTAVNNNTTVSVATIAVSPVANGCPGVTKRFTITVNPVPAVNQPVNQTLCSGSTTNAVSFTSAVNTTVFNWTNTNTAIGLAANGAGNIPSFTATTNGANITTGIISVTPVAFGCPGTPKSFSITVNPVPDVAQPADQVLCNNSTTTAVIFNSAVNGTVYSWTNTNTAIGLAASGTGNIAAFIANTNSTTIQTATITVTPSVNGCTGSPKTFTITVNPVPDVLQPPAQTLCSNSNTAPVNFSGAVNNTSFNWTNSNTAIGLAASGNGNIPSFTATTNGANVTTGTITVVPAANGCNGTPKTFTITVNPVPDVTQPADQTLCNNSSTAPINFSGAVNNTTYNWTNTNTAIGLAASGSGNIPSFTVNTNSNTVQTATITVTPTVNGCTGTPKTFTITVNPIPTVLQPPAQTLCNNSSTAAVNFSGAVNNTAYNWTNSNTAIGLAASGNGNIPSFIATTSGAAITSGTITVMPSANGCNGASKTFVITVNPTPDVQQPANQTLCSSSNTAPVSFSGAVNNTVYNWTNSNTNIGLAASGSGNIASFVAVNTANTAAAASATITVTPTANGCPGTPKQFVIAVNPTPSVMQVGSQALCNNGNTAPIQFTGAVAGASYNWTNTNSGIGLAASGSGDIASFKAVNTSAIAVTATIKVDPVTAACQGQSHTFTITVNPTPAVKATQSATVCLGKTVQLNATGATQYTWSPATNLSCASCASPSSTPTDTIRYTVTGTSAAGCTAADSILLTVIKPFKMVVGPGDSICVGTQLNMHAANANSYIWSPRAGLNRFDIADPLVSINTTSTYRVVGYDNHQCFTDTGFVTIVVGPTPTVNIGPDRSLAVGTPLQLHAVTGGGPIIRYLWTPAADLSCNNCASPSTTVKDNSFYSVVVTNTFGCTATDTIFINSFCKSSQVYIPNAFTPDGDGLNDILMVRGRGITVKSFRIFNRWGELVFEKENFYPNDPKFGWDGRVRGVPATPDVYVYTAEVFCDNNIPYTYKGNVTILK